METEAGTRAVLELRNVSKSYGAIKAVTDVSLVLRDAEVTALVGDNGAGKSTLVGIMSGVISPSAGTLIMDGREVVFHSPKEARTAGIETVYQDLALVDELDVAGNMFLGREHTRGGSLGRFLGALNLPGMRARTAKALQDAQLRVPDIDRPVRTMSGGQRQATAIVRTVFWGKRLLILDEPTAALGVDESEHALRTIEQLKKDGYPMLVVSHNLQHVFRISDRIVVLRHGRVQAEVATASASPEEVVGHITGATVTEIERRAARSEAGLTAG
ncbi:MAG: ATP-binding cassette domain-containing protein [Alphaproteobacteria bacterium]